MFLYGVSKFLFTALALAVVLALIASYFVAMTVVPLYCARYIRPGGEHVRGGEVDTEGEWRDRIAQAAAELI